MSLGKDVRLESNIYSLYSTLCELDLSPLKFHSVVSHSKLNCDIEIKEVEDAFTKKLASTLKGKMTLSWNRFKNKY